MSEQVRFVRIRGRIVPIRDKKKNDADTKAVMVASSGVIAASVADVGYKASLRSKWLKRANKDLAEAIKLDEKIDNVKEFSRRHGYNTPILNSTDSAANFFGGLKTQEGYRAASRQADAHLSGGGMASVDRVRGPYVIVGDTPSASVLGHELGHVIDYQKGFRPTRFNSGLAGALSGLEYKAEVRAWKNVRYRTPHTAAVQKYALKSYQIAKYGARIGAIVGAGIGIGVSAAAIKLSQKGDKK